MRAVHAQNFFRNRAAVRDLIAAANLLPGERVYDLGAGTGAIADEIARLGAHVIAVERDANLARKLRLRFAGRSVEVVEGDIAGVGFVAPYKVVANIPFNGTAEILKRLLFEAPHPDEALLVLQREAAEKYAGNPRGTLVSLMAMPWFEISILRAFERRDFVPAPRVDVVLLHIRRRRQPLLQAQERRAWEAFLHYAFARGRAQAWPALRNLFSRLQWTLLARDLAFAPGAGLSEITPPQWLGLYRFLRTSVPPYKRERLLGAHGDRR